MTVKIPTFKEPGLTDFLSAQFARLDREKTAYLSSATANHSVLLISSGMKVYELTVADDGTITTTLVAG